MTELYDLFVVYELENSGERVKLDIKQENLQNSLSPEAVILIIREDLRRIFIWKGSKSPVRKRFISSRVAQELQKELMDDARYHRCKIVSIDQGDELQEFLNAFRLESMEVTERLPDMRYIRNIERDQLAEAENTGASQKGEEEYYSPALADISNDVIKSSFSGSASVTKGKRIAVPSSKDSMMRSSIGLSTEEKEKIKKKILDISIPDEYTRQNLILGHELYGAVSKVSKVFGKDVEEIEWEKVKKLPKGVIELEEHKLRVYLDEKKGIVEAVEVLKKVSTQSQDKQTASPSKQQGRRELPKIPSKD